MGTPYPDKKARLKFFEENRPILQRNYSFLPKAQIESRLMSLWKKTHEGQSSNGQYASQVCRVNKPDKYRDDDHRHHGHQQSKNCGSFLAKSSILKSCLKSSSPPPSPSISSSLKSVTISRKPLKEDNNTRRILMCPSSFSYRPKSSLSHNRGPFQSVGSKSSSDDKLPEIVVSDHSMSPLDDPDRPRTTIEVIRYDQSIGFYEIDDQGPHIMSHSGERLPVD
ncbi:uncharacterized protein LOC141853152 [Brevipalpus obovatus]|uniref:uncharacterized protein LOC141853152 n=1 Tax=Brevipalpus obovatus TaxID=246614 RepID=UPI003D9EAD4D